MKLFNHTLFQACNYLSMHGLKLNHESKRGHRYSTIVKNLVIICGEWDQTFMLKQKQHTYSGLIFGCSLEILTTLLPPSCQWSPLTKHLFRFLDLYKNWKSHDYTCYLWHSSVYIHQQPQDISSSSTYHRPKRGYITLANSDAWVVFTYFIPVLISVWDSDCVMWSELCNKWVNKWVKTGLEKFWFQCTRACPTKRSLTRSL